MKHDISDITLRGILLFLILFAGLLGITASGGGGGGGGESPTTGNNPSVAAKTSTIPRGDADCPNGGILVETGIDENANGVLDADEVDEAQKVCNGADGAQGPAGSDGLNALVVIEDEPAGANCATGGKRIRSGLDANGDGMLDAAEVTSDDYICNGETGAQGPAGSDGHNALIDMNPEPVGANCPYGGLRVDAGIDDDDNGVLDANEIDQTGFVCDGRDGSLGWQVPTVIDIPNSDAGQVAIAMDGSGNAMAVWVQFVTTHNTIYANRYVTGAGWEGGMSIESGGNTEDISNPQVAMDADGNALAVWLQSDGTYVNVWGNHYTAGVGWDGAMLLESLDTEIDPLRGPPQVAMANGNGVAVWAQKDALGRTMLYAKRYQQGIDTKWSTNVKLTDPTAASAYSIYPCVAMDSSGGVMVVWAQSANTGVSVWSNRFPVGAADWEGPQSIVTLTGLQEVKDCDVAMDASGNAQAVWRKRESNFWFSIQSSRYLVNGGWQPVQSVETDVTGNAAFPQVAMDPAGNAMAVWSQQDGYYDIWANRYEAGSAAWGTARRIETHNLGDAFHPRLAMDALGNAMAVWQQKGLVNQSIWANRYQAGVGWGAAELVETEDAGDATSPDIAMDINGNATAVWLYSADGSTNRVWASRWGMP